MNTKIKNKKTKRIKKDKENHLLTFHEKVAKMSDCTPRYVSMVLSGERSNESAKAQRILANAKKVMESDNKLLDAVKLVAPPITSREKSKYGDSKIIID